MVWSLLWSSLTEDNVLSSYLKPWSFLLFKSSTEHEFLISGYYHLTRLMYGALLAEKKHIMSSQSSSLEFKLQSKELLTHSAIKNVIYLQCYMQTAWLITNVPDMSLQRGTISHKVLKSNFRWLFSTWSSSFIFPQTFAELTWKSCGQLAGVTVNRTVVGANSSGEVEDLRARKLGRYR